MKTILCMLFALVPLSAWSIEDVSLRLYPSFYDPSTKSIYVDVEIRYDGSGEFRLADQDIRIFYDSDQLQLDKDYSRSDLPQDLYSSIHWNEVMENLSADHINQLSFDDELGFINFSIDLNEHKNGGIVLAKDHSWQRIAVLNFKVDDQDALSHIVWSTPESTDQYATAFAEVTEWIAPYNTRRTDINTYVDAMFSTGLDDSSLDMTVYPNPASSVTTLSYVSELSEDAKVSIMDITGKEIQTQEVKAGSIDTRVDVSNIPAGSYLIEVKSLQSDKILASEQLIKVEL